VGISILLNRCSSVYKNFLRMLTTDKMFIPKAYIYRDDLCISTRCILIGANFLFFRNSLQGNSFIPLK